MSGATGTASPAVAGITGITSRTTCPARGTEREFTGRPTVPAAAAGPALTTGAAGPAGTAIA